jgi:hypothetical protein
MSSPTPLQFCDQHHNKEAINWEIFLLKHPKTYQMRLKYE